MMQLHVEATVIAGREDALAQGYRDVFLPAISRQDGFLACYLLTPLEGGNRRELLISFQSEVLRRKWVASADHQAAWPVIAVCLAGVTDRKYGVTAGKTVLDL